MFCFLCGRGPVDLCTSLQGKLRGHDQLINLVLESCHERVFSTTAPVEQVPLGLYIIRGDNVAVVGEMDEEADSAVDLSKVRGCPLGPVVH